MNLGVLVRRKIFDAVFMFGMICIGVGNLGMVHAALDSRSEAPVVDVIFTGRIQEDLARIDKLELRREKYFRKHRGETRRFGVPRLARSRYGKAEFALERLFPNLDNLGFESLIRRGVLQGLEAMKPDNRPARLKVTLLEMRIADYSVARYRSHATTMKGVVEVFDAEGVRTSGVKLTWEMIPLYTNDRGYSGREYVFLRESAYVRIAPVTLGFLEKALEQLFPGKDAPGPIFIWPPKSAAR